MTSTPRPRHTAASVARELSALTGRYNTDIQSVHQRLDSNDSNAKLARKKTERLDRIVAALGARVAQDHDDIVAELTPRLTRLEELVANGLNLRLAAVIVGFSQEEVRHILNLQDEASLTDSDIVTGIIDSLGRVQAQLGAVMDHLATTTGRVDNLEEIVGPNGANVATRVYVDQRIATIEEDNFPFWGVVLGAVAGLIVGLLWGTHNFDRLYKSGGASMMVHSWASDWWAAWLIGLGVTAIFIGLWLLFAPIVPTRAREETTTEEVHAVPHPQQQDNNLGDTQEIPVVRDEVTHQPA